MTCRSLSQITWSRRLIARNLTPVVRRRATGYGAPAGLRGEPRDAGGRRCRSASSGWATSAATSPTNLVADGHEVVVFDVDAARAACDRAARRRWRSVAEVGAASEITVLSLPTPAVVRQVADEWVDDRGARRRSSSTSPPTAPRSCASSARGSRPPATTWSRRRSPAARSAPQNRMLSFMVGGDDDAVARVQPVLEPLGRAFVPPRSARARQHHEAREQPDRVHHARG